VVSQRKSVNGKPVNWTRIRKLEGTKRHAGLGSAASGALNERRDSRGKSAVALSQLTPLPLK
jgi:hypothetical protein